MSRRNICLFLSVLLSVFAFSGCSQKYTNQEFANIIWISEKDELDCYIFYPSENGMLIFENQQLYKTMSGKIAEVPRPDGTTYAKVKGERLVFYDENMKRMDSFTYFAIKDGKLEWRYFNETICTMKKSEYTTIEEYVQSLGYDYLGVGQY